MIKNDITNDEIISAVRGLNIKDFSIRELEHVADLFRIKARQIDEEIRKRKAESRN